jgi:quinol monooxygenase YgiN
MLVNAVLYTFAPEDADRAADMLTRLRDASRTEPGCLSFDVARSNEDHAQFALFEQYRDQAALDAHFASAHFQELGAAGVRTLAKQRTGLRGTLLG